MLIPNALFEQVDGYSNLYWGWGYEDTDLISRFQAADIACTRRRGSFRPLHHDSDGYEADGNLNADGARNRALYMEKWRPGGTREKDGLSTLSCQILAREILAGDGRGTCEKITVQPALAGLP